MSQTSYSQDPDIGFAGMRYDARPTEHLSRLNGEASANLPCGVIVAQGDDEFTCLLPSSASDLLLGLVVSAFNNDSSQLAGNGAIAPTDMAGIARKGAFLVLPETSVDEGDPVYVRYTASVESGEAAFTPGRLRNNAAGTAQVATITPSATNDAVYFVSIDGHGFSYTADTSTSATEIVTGLKNLINADTDLAVTATGTSTLILTADVAGDPFMLSVGNLLSVAATTANAANAMLLEGARWASYADADTLAVLELNLPA